MGTKYIQFLTDISLNDIPLVGGKNASLGEMVRELSSLGIKVPLGFAITVRGYWEHLECNNLGSKMVSLLEGLSKESSIEQVQTAGKEVRRLIYEAPLPEALQEEIRESYAKLCQQYGQETLDVAVRSSATAEDLPQASFAGQQDTYLNIQGVTAVLDAVKRCMASLFTNRAIVYRMEQGFDHTHVAVSVAVQKMVRSDKASSGVIFTLDTETGFKDIVSITSSYGLGETIVKGIVNPDEFHVHKQTLALGYRPIIKRYLGSKEQKMVYKGDLVETIPVSEYEQQRFSLTDDDILLLAQQALIIEDHYSKLKKRWSPMDIEWAKDGFDNEFYIVQARPETVHARKKRSNLLIEYSLKAGVEKPDPLVTGLSIGQEIAQGRAVPLKNIHDTVEFTKGDVLVTSMTDPDWVPLMKLASAIITDKGGRTCHAAIVSRELGIPAVIGTSNATKIIKKGEKVTVDCSSGSVGLVYPGYLEYEELVTEMTSIPIPPVPIQVNIADPDRAYQLSTLPVSGVGLARLEFIISNSVRMHPMAACAPEKITSPEDRKIIEQLAVPYGSPKAFVVDTIAQSIATIAAAFYPRNVVVRLSDFKSNEYANLIAGEDFEPHEENPMLGFRGAARYCDPLYAPAFELECDAVKKARSDMGFKNIQLLIPFVRTLSEARCVGGQLEKYGLKRGVDDLKVLMMCEIPSNAILLEEFSALFDGFSIGSNDLTQFTLAVDRDSALLSTLFNENDPAVKKMLLMILKAAQKTGSYVSICGQAPSDFPELAHFLIEHGIDALSLNPDSVIPFLLKVGEKKSKK